MFKKRLERFKKRQERQRQAALVQDARRAHPRAYFMLRRRSADPKQWEVALTTSAEATPLWCYTFDTRRDADTFLYGRFVHMADLYDLFRSAEVKFAVGDRGWAACYPSWGTIEIG